jgi:hypothetical protein
MGKKSRRKGPKAARRHGGVEQHHREGKMLHPPAQRIERLHFTSWVHTRLPDQLPAALLITNLDRTLALNVLRRVAHSCQGEFKPGQDLDLTLSGIAEMPEVLRKRIIDMLCSREDARDALEPLLLFDDLPERESWLRYLGQGVRLETWTQLAGTVARVLSHQSQEATDTRWARVLFKVATGQNCVPEAHFQWLTQYPNDGDQRKVRPSIRASEIAEDPRQDYSARDRWAESFWLQCLKRTRCDNFLRHNFQTSSIGTSRAQVLAVLRELSEIALSTAATSGRNARHGAAFGLAAYALNILVELFGIGAAQGILGRLGLRAIFEAFATLMYLAAKDDPALWETYREYGQGQAKLAMLKTDDFSDPPGFVSPELLEELATEDKAPYFLSINLGHWASLDLRKVCEASDCKDEYDRIYPWTSAFVHANWAGVRAASMSICGNPLHRLHAVIQPAGNALGDVIDDACDLVDQMLDCLAKLYSITLPSVALGNVASTPPEGNVSDSP